MCVKIDLGKGTIFKNISLANGITVNIAGGVLG